MLIKHLVVCSQSLNHIHPQLYILFPPKLWGQCHQAPDLCICQIYIVFLWHWPRNVLLLCPFCFSLPRRKSCTIWCGKKEVSLIEREGEHSLYDLSQQIYYTWEKKMKQLYWKQMLTLCRLLKMERVHSVVAVTKGYWWQSRSLWWVTFPAGGGQQKQYETQNEVSLWFQRTRNTKDEACLLHFFPCRIHNIYLSYNIKAGKTS